MERIIGSYAVKSFERSQESHFCEDSDIGKGSVYGAIEPLVSRIGVETEKQTDFPTNQVSRLSHQHNHSQSLQKLLEQRPSILVYLVLLTSTLFLSTVMIWVWKIGCINSSYGAKLGSKIIVAKDTFSFVNKSKIKQSKLGRYSNFHIVVDSKEYQWQSSYQNNYIQVKSGKHYREAESITYGKIKYILPDIYLNEKNSFFYHLDISLARTNFMEYRQNIKQQSEILMIDKTNHFSSVATMFLASAK